MNGLGWLCDRVDPRDYAFGNAHPRAIGVPSDAAPSLLQYMGTPLHQGAASSCVGFALTRAIQLAAAVDGVDLLPSPAWIYWVARAQGRDVRGTAPPPPIVDGGCYPRLAMKAVQSMGLVRWDEWPYDDATPTSPPALGTIRAAFASQGLRYYRIPSYGMARIEEVARALSMRLPVIFGAQVDRAFCEHAKPEAVKAIDPTQIVGGHMMACVAVEPDMRVRVSNSWGSAWGGLGDGTAHIAPEIFGGWAIGDIYVVSAAVLPQPEAA